MTYRRTVKPLAIATFLALLLLSLQIGCGASALVVSGETLKASAEQFVKLGPIYKQGCDVTKTIAQSECQKFRSFGEQFQKSYPISRQLWEAARATNDPTTQEGAEVVIKDFDKRLKTFEAPVKK